MGVDAMAVFNRPENYKSAQLLTQHLNDKFRNNSVNGWELGFDGDYIESEDSDFSLFLGNKSLAVNFCRWGMFCKNISDSRSKSLPTLYALGELLEQTEFLVIPDSYFQESRAMDLLDTDADLKEYERYLQNIGSCRKSPENIMFTKDGCSNSHGYMHFSIPA